MENISIIWQYLSGNLDEEREKEVRKRIKNDLEYAQFVIKVKSVWYSLNESLSELNAEIISDYIHDRLSNEDKEKAETLLKETGDLDFYKDLFNPRVFVNENGLLTYDGVDEELKNIISLLNSTPINNRLYKQVEDFEKEPSLRWLKDPTIKIKIQSPVNHYILTKQEIEFTFDCKRESDIKGYLINIFDNTGKLKKKIELDGSKTIVDLSGFSSGHYFWKFSSPVNDLLEVRVFHLHIK
jgi:hypothetical protein